MTYYCSICRKEVAGEDRQCGQCHSDLAIADARPIAEKLCSALGHPEGEPAVRVACVLGERRTAEAVPKLIHTIEGAKDGFVVEAATEGLGKIGDPAAVEYLNVAAEQGRVRVRIAARKALQEILRNAVNRSKENLQSTP